MRSVSLGKRMLLGAVVLVSLLSSAAIPSASAHVHVLPHVHEVIRVTGTYNGSYDNSTGRGCAGPCTLSTSETQTWSHKWGVSIGFDKAPVKTTVGYDVTYSASQTFSYSFPVAAGETRVVKYTDWYHVTNMDVKTTYFSCLSGGICTPATTETGTAWAGQWYQRIFRADRA